METPPEQNGKYNLPPNEFNYADYPRISFWEITQADLERGNIWYWRYDISDYEPYTGEEELSFDTAFFIDPSSDVERDLE